MRKKITIPASGINKTIESENNFVIVGANGSGKSHLGAWIELHCGNVLRISAQRALTIPESVQFQSEEDSWNTIFFGRKDSKDKGNKWNWGKQTTTKLIDDYNSVLSAIFARKSNEDAEYCRKCKVCEINGEEKPHTTFSIEDKIIDIWNSVYPQRTIRFEDLKVNAYSNNSAYSAKDMSDGERVTIYLIGQCLVAPSDITIIIDEPELHLHKSIMHRLWDKVEEYCPDKTFVYITHDLDFASSRKDSKKIWVKNYTKESLNNQLKETWEWEEIESSESIPDELMIEILGNRKNVLFVEGEKGSYDTMLYSYIYDDYYVVPCHNCYKVIELTKAFTEEKIKNLHNVSVKGIIDRDYLSQAEIDACQKENVFPLKVAEVENLFLLPEIQRIVAENQALGNVDDVLKNVKDFIFEEFDKEKDLQITSICERELRCRLSRFSNGAKKLDDLKSQYETCVKGIDVQNLYNEKTLQIENTLKNGDLNELLTIYNRKNLPKRVSKHFGVIDYPKLVLRLLKSEKKNGIVAALKIHMPNINN